jgi:hypothetical protein
VVEARFASTDENISLKMVDRIRWKEGVSVRNILSHKVRIGRYYTEIRLSILSAGVVPAHDEFS